MSSVFLIADDQAAKRDLLVGLVRHSGWTGAIATACTTEEAEAVIGRADDIPCAFIDYFIPSQNGPAVIRAVRRAFPHARIALVSSSRNEACRNEAKRAGAECCICTSDPLDMVETALSDLLLRWRIERTA